MNVIGLTGGIGSGKTTVATIFEILEIPVYNSDVRAKYLMEHDEKIISFLLDSYGAEVYNEGGKLNRPLLSAIFFNNSEALSAVNAIVHPAVAKDFEIWKQNQVHKFVIKESALLLETMHYQKPDFIVVVIATKQLRIKRIQNRDQLSESEIISRMNKQLDDEDRLKYADFIIYNDGTKSLVHQTLGVFKILNSKL